MSTHDRRQRVEDACAALLAAGQPVAFDEVATRASLYRNPDLRAIIEEHRARGREAHTLTGLATETNRRRPPPAYINEFVFRFNRRRSRSRGMISYRVLELAVDHGPSGTET